jgi:hypothetical protein
MIRFYDREEYRRILKEFEAKGDLFSAMHAERFLRTTCGCFDTYLESMFWYYQPAKPFLGYPI